MNQRKAITVKIFAVFSLLISGCSSASNEAPVTSPVDIVTQSPEALLVGEVMAVAYSGFRKGQHPDRGDGAANTTVFFFEAFDEPWKGDPDNPLGAEKHWGLFNVDRTPKEVMSRN